jgi:hypothetical protein
MAEVCTMLSLLFGWVVIGAIVTVLVGIGFSVLSMNPPHYTIAQVCFTIAAFLLLCRTGWWIAFEQAPDTSKIQRGLFAFAICGLICSAWVISVTWVAGLRPPAPPPAEGLLRLPENRPCVIPAGYGKNKEQKSYSSYGLFVRNPGYDALEVQIPDALVGISGYTLVFPERLSVFCERDHIRFIESFLEHETMPGLDGGQLHDVMRKASVELFSFGIYYQDTGFLWYRTNCVVERTNRARNGLEVRTISQELTAPPTQEPTPLVVADSDPHVYIEPLNDEWVRSGNLPFLLQNRMGSIAHNIRIQPLTIGKTEISFPPLAHLDVNGQHKILPNIEGGLFQLHDILSPLSKAWQAQGEPNEDFKFSLVVEYTDVTKIKQFQATADLTYQSVQHLIVGNNALKAQVHSYEIIRLDDTTFKRLS